MAVDYRFIEEEVRIQDSGDRIKTFMQRSGESGEERLSTDF